MMGSGNRRGKILRSPPKKLLDPGEDELHAPVRGPLFSRPVLYTLLVAFGVSAMLTADWFGLLLLNSDGVIRQIGILNVVRVMGALMTGIAVPSLLLMFHYRWVYSYILEQNVFFATTFALSFVMGLPCVLVGLFGWLPTHGSSLDFRCPEATPRRSPYPAGKRSRPGWRTGCGKGTG